MTFDNEFWLGLLENSVLAFAFIAMVILFIRSTGQAIKAQEQARKDYADLAGPVFDTVLEQTRTLQSFKDKLRAWETAMNRMKDRCPYLKEVLDNAERKTGKSKT